MDYTTSLNFPTGEAWFHGKGPADRVALILAHLEPWIQAEIAKARREGRYQRRGAYAFDALAEALAFAAECRTGRQGADPGQPCLAGPPATFLVRADLSAIRRGHTIPGETCEIDGLGPVSIEALRAFFPQAAIDLILTDGVDVFNFTHFGRWANAKQQTVLDWFGGECSRRGCSATRHLQVDHRIDWAHTHVTELKALDWLCPEDHRRKTHECSEYAPV